MIHSKTVILDTLEVDSNTNNIGIFSVSNLSDNKSFPGSFLRKFRRPVSPSGSKFQPNLK